ncbi:WXG100 family type VII secretion target [Streptosporangium saharense]|uniref:WXG100 family type VII secretion target n=1 Tax=Streptosporangium saharense TaxID=1706840 RepID=A0A7W7QRY8_9ACTN|nr:WXG100 family type VII secretion target [Streptosporangium saharense]MBB4918677.1 WXG100 family type VII secretion target [Streptosporangium saharense]
MSGYEDYTKVNFGEMERVQENLLKVVTAMDTATDELMTKLAAELGPAWQGGASALFEEHRKIWDAAEQEMGRQLNEAAQALGTANANYRAAEARNKAIWSNR